MKYSLALVGLFLAGTLVGLANNPRTASRRSPESLLPPGCIAYFAYDGYAAHREAYDKTALAKVMKDDMGEFLDHVFAQLADYVTKEPDAEPPDDQNPPPQPKRAKTPFDADSLSKFVDYIWQHGFHVGLEARPRPDAADSSWDYQATFVFPEGGSGKNQAALDAVLRWLVSRGNGEVKETQQGKHTLANFEVWGVSGAWWRHDNHLVVSLGNQSLTHLFETADNPKRSLIASALYRNVAHFNRFETDMRGFVDLEKVIAALAAPSPDGNFLERFQDRLTRKLLLRHLGLTGLKDVSFHLGFERQYQRSSIVLKVAEPKSRQGLLRLISEPIQPVRFEPKELPALPADADSMAVRRVDWNQLYDYVRQSYQLALLFQLLGGDAGLVPFPDLDQRLGINFRKDFLEHLDSTVVTFGAHSEGPFLLGQGLAVKVKNAAKVRAGLEAIGIALTAASGEAFPEAEGRVYRGVEMTVFAKSPLPVSYAVHKDWLVMGLFPQPVQGFIRRSEGKYRKWEAPSELRDALTSARKESSPKSRLISVGVTDPRPNMSIGLSLLPAFAHGINLSAGSKVLDLTKVPSAQTVNEWLFPNVTLFFDDGAALRWESQYSIAEPSGLILPLALLSTFNDLTPWGQPRWAAGAGPANAAGQPAIGQQQPEVEEIPLPAREDEPKK